MDYYETLGVTSSATADEIKKSYKRLASKHHPDKGGDEAEFKKIQEAYEVLGNAEKRQQHDNPDPWANAQRYNGPDFGDLFGDVFANRRKPNPDSMLNIELTYKQAYEGVSYKIELSNNEQVSVTIPAGVREGTKLRLPGKAKQRVQGQPPGDLFLMIHIVPERNWGRQDDELFVNIVVDALDAVIGVYQNIHHINGKTYSVKIPAGTQEQERIRLKGLGMKHPSNGTTGSLHAIVNIEVPTLPQEEIIKLLNKIREIRGKHGS